MNPRCVIRDYDLALKKVGGEGKMCCCHCGNWIKVNKEWIITLRDSMQFLCEVCADDTTPELVAALMTVNRG